MKLFKYTLENLDCAHCASEIEQSVFSIKGIEFAKVDFILKTLVIQTDEKNINSIEKQVKDKIASIEDGVVLKPYVDNELEDDSEHKLKFRIFSILCVTVIFIAMILLENFLGLNFYLVFIALTLIAGYDVLIKGIKSIFKLNFNENLLMTVAIISAFFMGEFKEAAIVAILFNIGEILEGKAVSNSRKSIKALSQIRPDTAWILENNQEKKVLAESVNISDIIVVHPYERVPLDGEIIDGTSTLDFSAITGESVPIEAGKGLNVLSGAVNGSQTIKIRVTKNYQNSAASRIISMVESASAKKSKSEKFINKFAKIYTPIVLILACLITIIPPLLGLGDFNVWFPRALVFLVASCPCSLVISIPLGFYSAIGGLSKIGVLVKGGEYIEKMSKLKAIAFDKTGTLTSGELSVKKVYSFNDMTNDEIVMMILAAEKYSAHPIAMSIKKYALTLNAKEYEFSDYHEFPGKGVKAIYNGKEVLCGGRKLFEKVPNEFNDNNKSFVFLALDGVIVGALEMGESIRKESKDIINKIKNQGVNKVVMLTGDEEVSARKVADECGITDFYSGLSPGNKLDLLKEIRNKSGVTGFIGDGINDAPALTFADCGIAMGLGTEAALESADIVLTTGNLRMLPKCIKYCKNSMSVIYFNIVFSLVIKAVVLILATLGFAPMWLAVFADVGVSIITILNATRLLFYNKKN